MNIKEINVDDRAFCNGQWFSVVEFDNDLNTVFLCDEDGGEMEVDASEIEFTES